MFGLLSAAAILLGAGGLAKLRSPAAAGRALRTAGIPGSARLGHPIGTRLIAVAEIAVAGAAVALGGPMPAALLGATYLALALVSARILAVAPGVDCGCFGASGSPVTPWHVAVNVAAAAIGGAATIRPSSPLTSQLSAQPVLGAATVGAAALLAWLGFAVMSALPQLLRGQRRAAG